MSRTSHIRRGTRVNFSRTVLFAQAAIEAADTDIGQAQVVAEAIFNKRLEELADGDRYEELMGPIDELPAQSWGSGKKKATKATPSRPSRPSPRSKPESTEPEVEAPAAEDNQEDKFARLKARIES